MKKLYLQIIKYSLTGVMSAIADFIVFGLLGIMQIHHIIANICSYSCSAAVNYWMSVNFVFGHRDGWSEKKEFAVFVILSMTGMFVNTFFLWLFYDVIYVNVAGQGTADADNTAKMICKTGAMVILLICNFISKKLFFEMKKSDR